MLARHFSSAVKTVCGDRRPRYSFRFSVLIDRILKGWQQHTKNLSFLAKGFYKFRIGNFFQKITVTTQGPTLIGESGTQTFTKDIPKQLEELVFRLRQNPIFQVVWV